MVLTVNKLYKVAKVLEKDPEVLKLYQDLKSMDGSVKLTDVVVSVINNAGITDSDVCTITLFENDSLEITTYNGRLYHAVYDDKRTKRNANLTDDLLKQQKLTVSGEAFIKKYLPAVKSDDSNKSKKPYNGKKKPTYKKSNGQKKNKKEIEDKTSEE